MTIRRALVAFLVSMIAFGGQLVGARPAFADAVFVGGGAAAVQFRLRFYSDLLPTTYPDRYVALPSVTLPRQGSATEITAQAFGPEAALYGFHLLRSTTIGNLQGHPYAHSTATVGSVRIQASDIRAVRSECTWDTDGVSATTTIVDAAGRTYTPAANTTVTLPGGLGSIVLNEQQPSQVWDAATEAYADVISVVGVHLYPRVDASSVKNTYTASDISLAFSSCDPLNLPGLSSLRVAQPDA